MQYKKYPKDLVNSINKKVYKDLDKNEKRIVKTLFINVEDDDIIEINKVYRSSKKILSFTINGETKYATLLCTDCELLYEDSVFKFVSILKKLKFDPKFINDFFLLYWCDFTTNNTGKRRLDVASFFKLFPSKVSLIKNKFNETVNIMNFIDYFLFRDENINRNIYHLIYKDKEQWKIISRKELKVAISMYKNFNSNGIFIGPLCIQCKRRNIDFSKKYEYRRTILLVRW